MIYTFTGTKAGMTGLQRAAVLLQVRLGGAELIQNGACGGADREMWCDIRSLVSMKYLNFHFWPSNNSQREWANRVARNGRDLVWGIEEPLKRNRFMVKRGDRVIAAPRHRIEHLRSGTWATIRVARKFGKTLIICWPDGTVSMEKGLL